MAMTYLRRWYARMPVSARTPIATAYGVYLNWWRYGTDTERLVVEALSRDRWDEPTWRSFHEERLRHLLGRAARSVPYYREHWARRDHDEMDDLQQWPVIPTAAMRRDPRSFLADDVDARRMMAVATSGTSGGNLTTWRSRRATRAWYALFEARWRRWNGIDRSTRWAILGGQSIVPSQQTKPPFWVWNATMRQLYLSGAHLRHEHVGAYVEAMRRYRVRYLYGYPSALAWLASMIRDAGIPSPQLEVALTFGEPLLEHQRSIISAVFGGPARNTYGMVEMVGGASECAEGHLHVWSDAGVLEVLDDSGAAVPPGTVGRLVWTGLINDDMPFIRYAIGDRGALASSYPAVPSCGITLPILDRIEGRDIDGLVASSGARVFAVTPVLRELPIREAQIIQTARDHVEVLLVPEEAFDAVAEMTLVERLRQRLGPLQVSVHRVATVPRGPNGKFRSVVNRIPQDDERSSRPSA
jgi:phenylacetate-CoA ligase